jgi:hypothetical protein
MPGALFARRAFSLARARGPRFSAADVFLPLIGQKTPAPAKHT